MKRRVLRRLAATLILVVLGLLVTAGSAEAVPGGVDVGTAPLSFSWARVEGWSGFFGWLWTFFFPVETNPGATIEPGG